MQCKLKYASKNDKSFKTIMLRANQACTGGNENAIRATWATEQERETASRRPLLERSPHHRFIRLRVTPHKHYKLTL